MVAVLRLPSVLRSSTNLVCRGIINLSNPQPALSQPKCIYLQFYSTRLFNAIKLGYSDDQLAGLHAHCLVYFNGSEGVNEVRRESCLIRASKVCCRPRLLCPASC